MITNKQKAVALLKSFETGDTTPLDQYINPGKYIQHNLGVGDGVEAFRSFASQFRPGAIKVNIARVLEDGDYVACHSEYEMNGSLIGFDLYRFEDGKIVEHWDNLQKMEGPNPSGHTMIDGTTEVIDPDKTEANKALVKQYVEDLMVNGKAEKMPEYVGDNYIQHNPQIGDGIAGFHIAFAEWTRQGIIAKYDAIHKVIGEGNFVLVLSEGNFAGKPMAFYDLFRVADGKVAEHWDVLQEIPSREDWKNNNGKF